TKRRGACRRLNALCAIAWVRSLRTLVAILEPRFDLDRRRCRLVVGPMISVVAGVADQADQQHPSCTSISSELEQQLRRGVDFARALGRARELTNSWGDEDLAGFGRGAIAPQLTRVRLSGFGKSRVLRPPLIFPQKEAA